MPWSTSNRHDELPPDWRTRIVPQTRERAGGRCEARIDDGQGWDWPSPVWIGDDNRCTQVGTDCDHKGNRMDHEDTQWLCPYHHGMKTARESAAGRAAARRKLRLPIEKPPGLL